MGRIVVIGAGASGILAGIYAKNDNNEVIILEKNNKPLKKLLITGNGKCNYFNDDFAINHYFSNDIDKLSKIITEENKNRILSFFDSIGIIPKIKNGYYYPSSNQAYSIYNALLKEAELKGVKIEKTKLHGIKALRECKDVKIGCSDIVSSEFGWFSDNVEMTDTSAAGEYFMLRSAGLKFNGVKLDGKYSFQYITDSVFENCIFNTKDAFWHAKNVTVRNSVINGEYLAWYAENITFENCKISGTQPLCYCRGLKLIRCEMTGADFSFEKSGVEATLTAPVISIKNPRSGFIRLPYAEKIILDEKTDCEIVETKKAQTV